jgi:hypothetical protein
MYGWSFCFFVFTVESIFQFQHIFLIYSVYLSSVTYTYVCVCVCVLASTHTLFLIIAFKLTGKTDFYFTNVCLTTNFQSTSPSHGMS